MKRRLLTILLISMMVFTSIPSFSFAADTDSNSKKVPIVIANGVSSGKTAVKLSWLKTDGATKYSVKGSAFGSGYKTIVKKTSKVSYTVKKIKGKKLKANKVYRFVVLAYKDDVFLAKSQTLYVITNKTFSKKYANVSSVKVIGNNKVKMLGLDTLEDDGSEIYIGEPLLKVYKNKFQLPKAYGNKVRYTVDNPSVISVSKNGKITPKAKGEATVYVQAPNGKYDTVTVKVGKFTYKLNYDKNNVDAKGSMDDQTFIEDVAQNLYSNAFTLKGYIFKGWNTKADGSGTSYADKASISINADTTLYAQWEKEENQPEEDNPGDGSHSGYTDPVEKAKQEAIKDITETAKDEDKGKDKDKDDEELSKKIKEDIEKAKEEIKHASDEAAVEDAKEKWEEIIEKDKAIEDALEDIDDEKENIHRDPISEEMEKIIASAEAAIASADSSADARSEGEKWKEEIQKQDHREVIEDKVTSAEAEIDKDATEYAGDGEHEGYRNEDGEVEKIPEEYLSEEMKDIIASAEAELEKAKASADSTKEKDVQDILDEYKDKIEEQHEKEAVVKYDSNEGSGDATYQVLPVSSDPQSLSDNASQPMTAPDYDIPSGEPHKIGGKIFYFAGNAADNAKYVLYDNSGNALFKLSGATIYNVQTKEVYEISGAASESASKKDIQKEALNIAKQDVMEEITSIITSMCESAKQDISAAAEQAIKTVSDSAISAEAKADNINTIKEIVSSECSKLDEVSDDNISIMVVKDSALYQIRTICDNLLVATADASAAAIKTISSEAEKTLNIVVTSGELSSGAKEKISTAVAIIKASGDAAIASAESKTDIFADRDFTVNKLTAINEMVTAIADISSDAVVLKLINSVEAIKRASQFNFDSKAIFIDSVIGNMTTEMLKEAKTAVEDIDKVSADSAYELFASADSYTVTGREVKLLGWNTDKDWAGKHYEVSGGSIICDKSAMTTLHAEWNAFDQFYVVGTNEDGSIIASNNDCIWGVDEKEKKVGLDLDTLSGIGFGHINTRIILSSLNSGFVRTGDIDKDIWDWVVDKRVKNTNGCDDWYIGSTEELDALLASGLSGQYLTGAKYCWSSVQNSQNYEQAYRGADYNWGGSLVHTVVDNCSALALRSF